MPKRTEAAEVSQTENGSPFPTESIPLADLRPHPRNYRTHPQDQIEHIARSVEDNTVYRPVVVARDNTILAGHGLVLALAFLGRETAPCVRLDVEPMSPGAIKVLTGDNEIEHLAEQDDRLLTELLREVAEASGGDLTGTGFDESMLTNLVFVTRPASEIQSLDVAAHWLGMPEYDGEADPTLALAVKVSFRSEEDRAEFARRLGIEPNTVTKSMWWPAKQRENPVGLKFESPVETQAEAPAETAAEVPA